MNREKGPVWAFFFLQSIDGIIEKMYNKVKKERKNPMFENKEYARLEALVKSYVNDGEGDIDSIIRQIRAASLYGKIESYEEIHLMDLLPLNMADDIDDGERTVYDETTGGIPVNMEQEETPDMSFLDDYDEEEEEEESGFLSGLGL